MKIGFIGLGAMGRPMAEHLLTAGHELVVWARSTPSGALHPASVYSLEALGASVAESPLALARRCELVCTNVFSDADVEQLAFGEHGLCEGLGTGSIHVDFSTISPTMARRLATRYAEHGIDFVDAPVSGGAVGAQNKSLTIMWGGRQELTQRLMPLFNLLGKTVVRIGNAGDGQVAKACNQMIMVAAIQACAEAAHLANTAGVDFAKVRQAMLGGSAASRVLDVFGERMAVRDFQAGVMSRLHQKDYLLLLGEAVRLGVPLPVSASVFLQLNAALAMGAGERDSSCLVRVLECADGQHSHEISTERKAA
jgi:2-hydroxy-3-oxopropionate reductase